MKKIFSLTWGCFFSLLFSVESFLQSALHTALSVTTSLTTTTDVMTKTTQHQKPRNTDEKQRQQLHWTFYSSTKQINYNREQRTAQIVQTLMWQPESIQSIMVCWTALSVMFRVHNVKLRGFAVSAKKLLLLKAYFCLQKSNKHTHAQKFCTTLNTFHS